MIRCVTPSFRFLQESYKYKVILSFSDDVLSFYDKFCLGLSKVWLRLSEYNHVHVLPRAGLLFQKNSKIQGGLKVSVYKFSAICHYTRAQIH